MLWCMTPLPELITASEVADIFRVSSETVYRWARDGRIPSVKLPGGVRRFRRPEMEAMVLPAEQAS